MVLSWKKNYFNLTVLSDEAEERWKKDAIFHLFLNIRPSEKNLNNSVKYRQNQVYQFPDFAENC